MILGSRTVAMERRQQMGGWDSNRSHTLEEERLDRALVAGLMLEVVLENPGAAMEPRAHRRLIKARLKDALVRHLAGRVTLDRFRVLLSQLDHWFPLYYPLVAINPSEGSPFATATEGAAPTGPGGLRRLPLKESLLKDWLQQEVGKLLPQRSHRKLDAEKLRQFLQGTRGGWFRVKEFEKFFRIDRKTAWEYLQKLTQAGLLRHNQERSAAVRYCLSSRFVAVRAGALRRQMGQLLAAAAPGVAAQVADWLIATGGEAFWEDQWRERLDDLGGAGILDTLIPAVLEVLRDQSANRMLRLHPDWLAPEDEALPAVAPALSLRGLA